MIAPLNNLVNQEQHDITSLCFAKYLIVPACWSSVDICTKEGKDRI